MASGLISNFTTGRPYFEPTEKIDNPQESSGFNFPSIRLPKSPNDENPPEENPPGEGQPKEAPPEEVPWYERVGKAIESGAEDGLKAIEGGGDVPVIEGIVRTPISQGMKAIESVGPKIINSDQFGVLQNDALGVGKNLFNWGNDALKGVETGAKATNSFLESTSNGGGLVNAAKGTGQFAPGGGDVAPESSGFKMPDSWSNVGTDLGDLVKGIDF